METTFSDLRKSLDKLTQLSNEKSLQGLILDMRNNPGGLLNQAVQVSDLFLKDGVVVYTDGRMKSQQQKYFAVSQGTEPDYPLVILINEGSASASEIVAGAMKDSGRAIIVGKTSFGKGSVQTITPLDNGGALTLTTALYYTKSGKSIQLTGVKPDVEVEIAKDKKAKVLEEGDDLEPIMVREGDLPGAIKNPSNKKDSEKDDQGNRETSKMQELNKTPVSAEELNSSRIENIDLKIWKEKDLQFAKAWEIVRSFEDFARE
jgi:carboxyl-terminal processing protease